VVRHRTTCTKGLARCSRNEKRTGLPVGIRPADLISQAGAATGFPVLANLFPNGASLHSRPRGCARKRPRNQSTDTNLASHATII